ncbi:MAG: hypothetical protein D3907_10650 [Candidatus Electrothrix sp. AUS3]|nr:hypothetical protein [Candidatus Electrothrix gigas]
MSADDISSVNRMGSAVQFLGSNHLRQQLSKRIVRGIQLLFILVEKKYWFFWELCPRSYQKIDNTPHLFTFSIADR